MEFFRLGKKQRSRLSCLAGIRLISLHTARTCIGVAYRGDTNLSAGDLTPFVSVFSTSVVGCPSLLLSEPGLHKKINKNKHLARIAVLLLQLFWGGTLYSFESADRAFCTASENVSRVGKSSALPLPDVVWRGAFLRPSHFLRV